MIAMSSRFRSTTIAVVLVALPWSVAVARKAPKPQYGLFGTIHGKPFKATNNGRNDDLCVSGIYKPGDGIFVMAALECRSLKRRVQKKNYKTVALSCSRFDPAVPIVPPYEIPCYASAYTEYKTGRFGALKSQTTWTSSFILDGPYPTSGLNLRIESFDGTVLQGKLFGTFDMPLDGATGTADVSGEATLNLPVKVQ